MTATTTSAAVNAISWFEIPCTDLDRGQAFYEKVLGRPMQRVDFGGDPMAVFAYDRPATGGCLAAGPQRRSTDAAGVRIYLDCAPSLGAALARVAPAGGEVVDDCTALPQDMGYIAHIRDLDGNLVGLHTLAR
ncbi:VOC family protein [Xylophilus sp. GW821-FHT01B05]